MDATDAPPRHVEGTLRGFHSLGVPVHLICPQSEANCDIEVLDQLTEFEFMRLRGGWRWFSARVAAHIATTAYPAGDVLYFRFTPSSMVASALRHVRAVKVLEVNGTEFFDHPRAAQMVAVFDLILVESECIAEALRSRFGDLVSIECHLTPGVDVANFAPFDKRSARRDLGWDPDQPICLWVSGYQPHQDLETLVRVIQRSRGQPGCPKFVLLGDGLRRSELVRTVEGLGLGPWVDFVDPVSHEKLPQYICAADVCMNLQYEHVLREGNHRAFKLYEYAACARPIVDTVDTRRNVFDWLRCSAVFVPPNSPDQVVQAIRDVLADVDAWFRRAKQTRAHVVRHRSWRAVTESTLHRIEAARSRRSALP